MLQITHHVSGYIMSSKGFLILISIEVFYSGILGLDRESKVWGFEEIKHLTNNYPHNIYPETKVLNKIW
jgi:hypothetical protein